MLYFDAMEKDLESAQKNPKKIEHAASNTETRDPAENLHNEAAELSDDYSEYEEPEGL
jgi:hypothetical protein